MDGEVFSAATAHFHSYLLQAVLQKQLHLHSNQTQGKSNVKQIPLHQGSIPTTLNGIPTQLPRQ